MVRIGTNHGCESYSFLMGEIFMEVTEGININDFVHSLVNLLNETSYFKTSLPPGAGKYWYLFSKRRAQH
jgi:hypothetical protein